MPNSTNFADSKKRVIRLSDKGKYYVVKADGTKSYAPKAAFKKTSAGGMKKLQVGNVVPNKLKRATRSNKGVKRGPVAGPRKPRANKGVARGPQAGVVQRRMNASGARRVVSMKTPTEAALYQMIFGTPPPRRVARKPARKPAARKPVRKTARKPARKPVRKSPARYSPLKMMLRSRTVKK